MLLEKAYAKLYGSYQAIESGLTGMALSTLTGAPYEYLCKDSSEKINDEVAWNFLNDHLNKNHLVSGSSENNDRNGYLGLVPEHAYAVLDAKEVFIKTNKGQKKERILKLMNPWGTHEWEGTFASIFRQMVRVIRCMELGTQGTVGIPESQRWNLLDRH